MPHAFLVEVLTLKVCAMLSIILQYLYMEGFFPGVKHIRVRGGVTSAMGQAGSSVTKKCVKLELNESI